MSGADGGSPGLREMGASRIRAVLFDVDGTLVATRRLYLEAFADALEPVLGRRPGHDEMMALHPRAEIRFLRELGGEEAHRSVMERFYEAYENRHERDFQGIYPGIREMLAGLRSLGTPLGLVTGKSRRSWSLTAPRVELGPFSVAIFDDDVPESKPDPSGLQAAVKAFFEAGSLGPNGSHEVLYVGDSPTDLEAAAGAGVRPGAALWSKRPHERDVFQAQAEALGGIALPTPTLLLEMVHTQAVLGTSSPSSPSGRA
jgi:pyrophosphatase PpaX